MSDFWPNIDTPATATKILATNKRMNYVLKLHNDLKTLVRR